MSIDAKLAEAKPNPYWFSTVPKAAPCAPAIHDTTCDLVIVGGGFTGLWLSLIHI